MRGTRFLVRIGLACLWISLAFGTFARGDVIHFRNGDRITGSLLALNEGRVNFATKTGLEVEVVPTAIYTMETDGAVLLVLKDGRNLTTQLFPGAPGTVFSSERERIPIASIDTINPPPKETKWTGGLFIGGTMSRGNSDSSKLNGTVEVVRRSITDRLSLTGAYFGGRQRDPATREVATTEKNYNAVLQYDVFVADEVFVWTKIRGETDEVAALDLRLILGAGLGYQWVERTDWTLSTELGLSWQKEEYATSGDEEQVSGRVAWRYRRSYFDGAIRLLHTAEWFPSLEDGKDHLVLAQAGLQAPLTDTMAVEFRVEVEWDSTPAPGAERTDVLYIMGLNFGF